MNSIRQTGQDSQQERVIITVVGKDRVGIIAGVTAVLAKHNVNILDISQTIMQDFFTMIMIADIAGCKLSLQELQIILKNTSVQIGVDVNAQHEDIFKFMHRI